MKKINLLTDHEDLADQWHYSRNTAFNIQSVNSSAKVWWKCDKGPDHFWEALVCHRIKGLGCPCCSNLKAVASNCLSTTHPELASQWHLSLNESTPEMITSGSNKKVWWQCDVATDHYWQSAIVDRVRRNTGCPLCNGKKGSSTNNLALMFPDLAEEWDLTNSVSVTNVPFGSAKKFWWKCKNNHRWQATINNRTNHNQQCPYCSGKKADHTTSLLAKYPEICEEWDYEKNLLSPNELLPSSHKKVYWVCKKDEIHKWVASPLNRTVAKSNCPYCNSSAGETVIKNYMSENKITFSRQYRIPECKNKRALPFDFAIHLNDRIVLVEFQGKQHYEPVDLYGGIKTFLRQQENDNIKRSYCKSNGIELIEIRYDQVKDIPRILGALS